MSLVTWALFSTLTVIAYCEGAAYNDSSQLYDDKLGSGSGYKTTLRPLIDQTGTVEVNVTFDIVAIVEINAISQKFIVNGFMGLSWIDQIVAWDPKQYNNVYTIHPEPKQVWRPRLIMTNTIDKRDIFQDDYSPMTAVCNGWVGWYPGSLFPTSCKLNLYKYPFDEQNCYIEMYSMGWAASEVQYRSPFGKVGTAFFVESGEWTIESTHLEAFAAADSSGVSHFKISFKLKRLPGFFIVNIVIPIVLMSFLNILVFLIPVDSGEKISYGITVLLALTVFMSIVSEQLPRSSDTLPVVTIYLLVLTVISVCTVIVSIAIVYCHHMNEKKVRHRKAATGFKSIFHKFKIINRAADNFSKVHVKPASTERQFSNSSTNNPNMDGNGNSSYEKEKPGDAVFNVLDHMKEKNRDECSDVTEQNYVNRWKQVGKHLDCISFVVFTVIWISVTIGFLVEIAG